MGLEQSKTVKSCSKFWGLSSHSIAQGMLTVQGTPGKYPPVGDCFTKLIKIYDFKVKFIVFMCFV